MVLNIRTFENMRGNGIKKVEYCEKKNISVARKSIVSKTQIKKDEFFTLKNITVKRPGNGISASKFFDFIGKKSRKNYEQDQLID